MEQRWSSCEMIAGGKKPSDLILETDYAFGVFSGYYHEVRCTVI